MVSDLCGNRAPISRKRFLIPLFLCKRTQWQNYWRADSASALRPSRPAPWQAWLLFCSAPFCFGFPLSRCLLGFAALRVLGPIGDPGYVVIDEIAGQFVALLPLARPAWPALIAAFLLFRLFDILKPPPLSRLDRYEHALGVMGDDLAAGVLAAAALWLLSLVWPDLFGGVLRFSQL